MPAPTTRSDSGFTLVELLVVITMMSVIMGFAVGGWRSYAAAREQSGAGQQVREALRQAQQQAVTEGTSICVDFQATSFQIFRGACDDSSKTALGTGRQLPQGLRFDAPLFATGPEHEHHRCHLPFPRLRHPGQREAEARRVQRHDHDLRRRTDRPCRARLTAAQATPPTPASRWSRCSCRSAIVTLLIVVTLPQLLVGMSSNDVARKSLQEKGFAQAELERMRNLPFHIAPAAGDFIDVLDRFYPRPDRPGHRARLRRHRPLRRLRSQPGPATSRRAPSTAPGSRPERSTAPCAQWRPMLGSAASSSSSTPSSSTPRPRPPR